MFITCQEQTLKLERADRRRLVFASALSVIALPAIWLANHDESRQGTTAPNVAAVGLEAGVDTQGPDVAVESLDPMASGELEPEPLFLTGPRVGPEAGHVAVATPEPDGESTELRATYRRGVGSVGTCRVNEVPAGIEVTVTNLDNGRAVECWTGPTSIGAVGEIALHPDQYQQLARFSDAPVPVEVSW